MRVGVGSAYGCGGSSAGVLGEDARVVPGLLSEAGAGRQTDDLVTADPTGVEAAADWGSLKSPENYLGSERTENFVSPGGLSLDADRAYELPARFRLNERGAS